MVPSQELKPVICYICPTPGAVMSCCLCKWNYISCLENTVWEPLSKWFICFLFSNARCSRVGWTTHACAVETPCFHLLPQGSSSARDYSVHCFCFGSIFLRELQAAALTSWAMFPLAGAFKEPGWLERDSLTNLCLTEKLKREPGFGLSIETSCFWHLEVKCKMSKWCCSTAVPCSHG